MVSKYLLVATLLTSVCLGQLPDRDELTAQFKNPETSHQAAEALLTHFGMGGIRTIIRNLNDLDVNSRLAYGNMFRNMDMFRFRDDLNNNLGSIGDDNSKAMYLMLVSSAGRQIAADFFNTYVNDENAAVKVRLAAAGGTIKIQNPELYNRFLEIADRAVVDFSIGQNDLYFANLSKENLGFFLFTKAKIEDKKAPHGAIVCALEMAENADTDIYETLVNNRKKKYYPIMIDHAVQVGGTDLLAVMEAHKSTKKFRDQISKAKDVAAKVAQYRSKFADKLTGKHSVLVPYFPIKTGGTSEESGYHSAYAVAKVAATGDISLLFHSAPFGHNNDNLKSILSGRTMPAYIDFEPVETYVFVPAP